VVIRAIPAARPVGTGPAGKVRAGMADLTPVTSRTWRWACPPVRQTGLAAGLAAGSSDVSAAF